MKKCFFILSVIFASIAAYAQNGLLIKPGDIRLVPDSGSTFSEAKGYHLFVRKLPQVESIMLVETTKDPAGKNDSYAYRALEYNKINGDEIRFLNGKKLESEYSKFSLIDSTPEPDEQFGSAFHIYIPKQMEYGYPWSRNGKITIDKGTFINIRSFEKKYADYTGGYYDNAYMFDLGEKIPVRKEQKSEPKPEKEEIPILTDDYNPVASAKFSEISDFMTYSKGPDTIVEDIMDALNKLNPKDEADVVFAIDATGSMKDDIEQLRKEWVPNLIAAMKDFKDIRLGLLLYRDYGDNFKFRNLPVKFFDFTDDLAVFSKNLNSFKINGKEGGDIPEAVYEALYASLEFYGWRPSAQKKIILIGDAEPHPTPRGTKKYTKNLVQKIAQEKQIQIEAIITPDEKDRRGR